MRSLVWGLTLRRLLFAFLLSVVIGLFASSIAQASSCSIGQLGPELSSPVLLVHTYDAVPTFSTRRGSSGDIGVAASGVSTPAFAMGWVNTPSAVRTAAADGAATDMALATDTSSGSTLTSQFTSDQNALIQLAKGAKQAGGITSEEAQTLRTWADEYGVTARGPEIHPARPFGQFLHLHIGPINHIPIIYLSFALME